jgi:hypothetical protein
LKCLAKDPDQRFQSMREIQAALELLRRQYHPGVPWEGQTIRTVVPPPARRSSKVLAIGVAAVLVAAAAGFGYWWIGWYGSATPASGISGRAATTVAPDAPLTNNDIVAMAQAKVAPDVMIGQIRASKTNFNLSAAEVIRLSKAGVPAQVMIAMREPHPEAAPSITPAVLRDGLPVHLILARNIPGDAQRGDVVRFRSADDVSVGGAVAIASGASATGAIVDSGKKKIFVIGGKMTFLLESVEAVDGQKVPIRATLERPAKGASKRPVNTGGKRPKGVAAEAGAEYTAYINGAHTVMVKK